MVLHQATFHPDTVREQVRIARRRAGGGRGFISSYEARVQRQELGRAHVIRVESSAVRNDLIDRGVSPDKIVLAAPGVDLARFQPQERGPDLLVAFVGTLSLWKGVDVLTALQRSLAGIARLEVIGGPVDPWSRRVAAAAGFARAESVEALLGRADALVLPSASDGFGYVVLEAMAAGAVPFVTPSVGARDVVGQLAPELVIEAENFADVLPDLVRSLPLAELSWRARRLAANYERNAMAQHAMHAVLVRCGLS